MRSQRNEPVLSAADSTKEFRFRATRWESFLSRNCLVYRNLEEERLLGWNSSELDMWYASHHKEGPTQRDTSGAHIESGKETAPPVEKPLSTAGVSSFATVDIARLSDRYRKYCQSVLGPAAPRFFTPCCPDAQACERPLTFLDLGCAPGGVSRFLLEDLEWEGVGLTLPPTMSGIDIDLELLEGRHAARYALLAGDVCQPPTTWRRWLTAGGEPHAGEGFAMTRKFTFVNGGAVQDHGQRAGGSSSTPAPKADRGDFLEFKPPGVAGELDGEEGASIHARKRRREDGNSAQNPVVNEKVVDAASHVAGNTSTSVATPPPEAILPWLTLFTPQLRLALDYVERDGSGGIMLVYGAPQCASFFILLYVLEQILLNPVGPLQTGASRFLSSSPPDNLKVLETIHLSKSPVYVLLTKVRLDGRVAAIERLMAALDPSSSTLYPMENLLMDVPARGGMARNEFDLNESLPEDRALRLEAKRRFWLGESDAGFTIAREAFQRYVPLVSAIWQKNMRFLRKRRTNAERQAAQPSNGSQ